MIVHGYARLSVLPTEFIESLDGVAIELLLNRGATLQQSMANELEAFDHHLYTWVSEAPSTPERKIRLKLKQRLLRSLGKDADIANVFADESAQSRSEMRDRLSSIVHIQQELARIESDCAAAFDAHMRAAREHLVDGFSDRRLSFALSRASATLYGQFLRMQSAGRIPTRSERVVRGLTRYALRASMKATPFSSFCAIAPLRIVEARDGGSSLFSDIGTEDARSDAILLNKAIYQHIWAGVLGSERLQPLLPLELNPSLIRREGDFMYLSLGNNQEAISRLPRSAAIDVLIDKLESSINTSINELAEKICNSPDLLIDRADAVQVIEKLVQLGVLRVVPPVGALDGDWLDPLATLLQGVGNDGPSLSSLLRKVEELCKDLHVSSNADIVFIESRIRETLNEITRLLQMRDVPASTSLIFHDHASPIAITLAIGRNTGGSSPAPAANRELLVAMRELCAVATSLSGAKNEMATIRALFDRMPAPGQQRIGLPAFLEHLAKHFLVNHFDFERRRLQGRLNPEDLQRNAQNPLSLPLIDQRQRTIQQWFQHIQATWSANRQAEEISVDCEVVESLKHTYVKSCAMFCEPIRHSANDAITRVFAKRGRVLPGYGKYFSRFLEVLPDAVIESLRRLYVQNDSCVLAELGADGNFNGNIHTTYLPAQIDYPSRFSRSAPNTIPLGDIEVRADPVDAERLVLWHRTKQTQISLVDLGFLNPTMRPPFYQALTQFSEQVSFAVPIPTYPDLESSHTPPAILYRPRMVWRDKVVVSRRHWSIKPGVFPTRAASENDLAYFERLGRWRREHKLPEQCFAHWIWPVGRSQFPATKLGQSEAEPEGMEAALESNKDESTARPNRPARSLDDSKPQYLSFQSPFIVLAFERQATLKSEATLVLEERYPQADGLVELSDGHHALELLLQFDEAGKSATTEGFSL